MDFPQDSKVIDPRDLMSEAWANWLKDLQNATIYESLANQFLLMGA
jgi:hypothetical protein